jgi:hypothetical protein
VEVQNNLGSALLNMANAAGNPVEYVRMYKESEDLLLKVLQLQPSYTNAKANLATVRKNLKMHLEIDGVADHAVTNDRAKEMDSYGDDRADSVWDDDDDQVRAFDFPFCKCLPLLLEHCVSIALTFRRHADVNAIQAVHVVRRRHAGRSDG